MKTWIVFAAISWHGLWFTADQYAHRLFQDGNFQQAAEAFEDPMWQGTAWYRAGEFEKAAAAFLLVDTPQSNFNRGNALLFSGKYDQAIESYERSLEQQPDWEEAIQNRNLAIARRDMLKNEGGDLGDQQVGADKVVFDAKKPIKEGEETKVDPENASQDNQVQALWLRRVQTKPADFLKAKFSYQLADEGESK